MTATLTLYDVILISMREFTYAMHFIYNECYRNNVIHILKFRRYYSFTHSCLFVTCQSTHAMIMLNRLERCTIFNINNYINLFSVRYN